MENCAKHGLLIRLGELKPRLEMVATRMATGDLTKARSEAAVRKVAGHCLDALRIGRLPDDERTLRQIETVVLVIDDLDSSQAHTVKRQAFVCTSILFYLFLSAEASEAIVGDLEEGFASKSKASISKAHHWYWSQVITSIAPLAWAALVRKLRGVSVRNRL
jgi:hypothetical protein